MIHPADLASGPSNPVRAILDRIPPDAPGDYVDPRRAPLELLAPAWDALDRAETVLLARMPTGPMPHALTAMADLCNSGCDYVVTAAHRVAAFDTRGGVDESLTHATDLAYVFALTLPSLPESVRRAVSDVADTFAVGREPDLYARVLDTLPPYAGAPSPAHLVLDDERDTRRFAVASRAVSFDEAVRAIRGAAARVSAAMVPLARMAAVCLAGTRAPHDTAAGMRRDVAFFVVSVDRTAREFLADLSAWLVGSPRHHLHGEHPSDWAGRLDDALDTLWKLGQAPSRVIGGPDPEAAAAASGLRGDGALRWVEWASSDVETLIEVLEEHQDAVREWHRTVGTADLSPGDGEETTPPAHTDGDGDGSDEAHDEDGSTADA